MEILIVLASPLMAVGIGYLYALKRGAHFRPEYANIA
jgi:hypothetical protein